MKVAVVGVEGQLGVDISREFLSRGFEVSSLAHTEMEIVDLDNCMQVLQESKPDIIVNTAAYHHLEICEKNPDVAFAVNALGARNLALTSNEINATLVHISTDYVFNGDNNVPYEESDLPNPLNVYGNTKLAGEHFVHAIAERHFILRTSGLYGHNPCRAKGHNFVELMLKLAQERDEIRVVNDEVLTPTSTLELALQVVEICQSDSYGYYHATCEGSCSWYKFAREIFNITKTDITLNIADPDEFPMKTPRPKYSVLENVNLKKNELNIFTHWKTALAQYLNGR